MFNENVIHDIAMLCLEKSTMREPKNLAELYKKAVSAIKAEFMNDEDEEEIPPITSNRS